LGNSHHQEGRELLEELIGGVIRQGMHIIDVGCGDCSILRQLVEEHDVYGVGVDPHIMQEKDEGNPRCLRMRAEELSVLGEMFDILFSHHSLHHIQNVDKFLREAFNTLKKGGWLVIVDWKTGAPTGRLERYYSLEELVPMVEDAGFRVVSAKEGVAHLGLKAQK